MLFRFFGLNFSYFYYPTIYGCIYIYPNPVKLEFPWLLTIRKGAGTIPFPLGKPRARVIYPLNPRAPRMWSKPSLMKGEHFCLLLAHTNPVAPEFKSKYYPTLILICTEGNNESISSWSELSKTCQ